MPDDIPKSSHSEEYGFEDEPSIGDGGRDPSKPVSPLTDFGTLDADVFNQADNDVTAQSETPSGTSTSADFGASDLDVFKLEGDEAAPTTDDDPITTPPRMQPEARNSASKKAEVRPDARVDEVWSRGKEWGSTLLLVGGVGCATLMLVYFALSAGQFGLGFALLSVGMLACVVLSYPMVITLERPVRMTPEQAVRDYYAALSHHRPHFRRMWLLLSTKGRSSSRFGSFEGFVKCWRSWLLELRGLDKNTWTPLHFDIHGMKAEKSAGRQAVRTDYGIRVFVRGHRDEAPLASFSVRQWTVRGPDGMWYLDDGNPPTIEVNPIKNRKESAGEQQI